MVQFSWVMRIMARQARQISPTGLYHVVFRGVNKQDIFEEDIDYEKMITILKDLKEEMKFEILVYCLMSNHVHILLKENVCGEISLIMKRLLTKYARWYNIKYGRSGALIANRYKSVPVEVDEYFLELIRYVHQNPVKAGIAKKPEDYSYSSYTEYVKKANICDVDFVFGMMGKTEFKEFHKENGKFEFKVTDSKKKSDEEVIFLIKKEYQLENSQEISKMPKPERNKIIAELKLKYSTRQLQRITGVSRSVISKIKQSQKVYVPNCPK